MPTGLAKPKTLGKPPSGDARKLRGSSRTPDRSLPTSLIGIPEALRTVRHYLGMDVAFVSEFVGRKRIFRYVDAQGDATSLRAGDVLPLERGFCRKIADGCLPSLIPDAACLPDVDGQVSPAETIGAHLGVALRLPNGRLYGTFCCYKAQADLSLNERDLRFMQIFGDLIARQIAAENRRQQDLDTKVRRIRQAITRGEPSLVYQPVFRLQDGVLVGAEALARFGGAPVRSPDRWFGEAGEVGLQIALELQAIRNAIAGFEPTRRHDPTLHLAINASPETLVNSELATLLRDAPVERMTLEITEHERVENYDRLTSALAPLRRRGCKIAVDDAGSGYASLRHILNIEPDVIKLDVSLTSGIDASAGKRALASSLIEFSRQTGNVIIAEGVETCGELATLCDLRVNSAQGYLLARPAPVADLCERLATGGHPDTPIHRP